MRGKSRVFLLAFSCVILLSFVVVLGGAESAVGNSLPGRQSGQGQIVGLDLRIVLEPSAVSPGDILTLTLELANQRGEPAAPEVIVALPNNLSVSPTRLPHGASLNMAANSLSWQPVVSPMGGTASTTIQATVNAVELNAPEHTLTVTLRDGGAEQVFTQSFWIGVMPSARIRFEPAQAAVGQPLRLVGEIEGPRPVSQEWVLGDGRVVNANDPIVVYPEAGSYQVTLRAANPLGLAVDGAILNIVPDVIAAFTPADPTVAVDQPVTFVNQSGGQGSIAYSWDFGDGATSREADPVHHYTVPGTYTVHLVAESELGRSESEGTVTVGVAPLADMLLATDATAGRLLEFRALTDNTVTEIHWNTGDGHTTDGVLANHVYWTPGEYLVSMTAVNQFGETTVVRSLQVGTGSLFLYLPMLHATEDGIVPQLIDSSGGLAALEVVDVQQPPAEIEALSLPADMTAAEQLIIYVNEARRLSNLPGLNYVQELGVAAQGHTDDMAANGYVGHSGSDGSTPAYRLRQAGYAGGYGGEATAWGIQSALEVVRFWLNSPSHRMIILNPAVTDLGVGYTQDLTAPNVWYWTAEFASLNLPVVDVGPLRDPVGTSVPAEPSLALLGPPQGSEFVLAQGNDLIFTWAWPLPLQSGARFVVYLQTDMRPVQIGVVDRSEPSGQYQLRIQANQIPAAPGDYAWQVRLENTGRDGPVMESALWPIFLRTPSEDVLGPDATPSPGEILPTPTQPADEPGVEPAPLPVATPIPVPAS